jgi:hypothetical protein
MHDADGRQHRVLGGTFAVMLTNNKLRMNESQTITPDGFRHAKAETTRVFLPPVFKEGVYSAFLLQRSDLLHFFPRSPHLRHVSTFSSHS